MELGLKINTEKSKIMVFRKGGFLGRCEEWSIDGNQLEVVNKYVYLGFTFTTSMSLQESAKQPALKGKRALFDVLRLHSRLEQMTRNTFFMIFDSKIQPILLIIKIIIHKFSIVLFTAERAQRACSHTCT